MNTTDPNRSGVWKPYRDPNKVPVLLLAIGLMLGLVAFLVFMLDWVSR